MKHVDEVALVAWLDPATEPSGGPRRLGLKAWNLWRVARAGLAVPPGFVVTTDAWRVITKDKERSLRDLEDGIDAGIRRLEETTRCTLGGTRRPLVVSVRSGAPVSMPGMLDTVLDVGLSDRTVRALIRMRGNPRLAWDSYRRFVESWATVVAGCDASAFANLAREVCEREHVASARELDALALRELTQLSLEAYRALTGERFPQDARAQVHGAVRAVLRSWSSPKAREYRRLNRIDEHVGTAATVQAMVFGNAGGASGSGVGFTRNPATGARELYVDFLFDAQGEDIVSGRHSSAGAGQVEASMPAVAARLREVATILEASFGDMQDFEFTVEEGELIVLQTRTGKRTPWAACRIAVDFVAEGRWSKHGALAALHDVDLGAIVRSRLDPRANQSPIARATPASLGVAIGAVALDGPTAQRMHAAGRPCVLVRPDTSTEDIAGLAVAEGVLTGAGGRTAHAAVIARQLDKVCLVGCPRLAIDLERRRVGLGEVILAEGDVISLDGETGEIYAGALAVRRERPTEALSTIERWKDEAA